MSSKVRVLVLYDIPSNALRSKVFAACLDQGLEHWQASVFMGDLSLTRRRELQARLADLMSGKPGHVHLQPIGHAEVLAAWIRS